MCKFSNIVVADLPSKLQLAYLPGHSLRCSADGNPEPTYQWKDLINGTVTEGAVLVFRVMAYGNYTFQCTATNQYNSVSSVFNFTFQGIMLVIIIRTYRQHDKINYSWTVLQELYSVETVAIMWPHYSAIICTGCGRGAHLVPSLPTGVQGNPQPGTMLSSSSSSSSFITP